MRAPDTKPHLTTDIDAVDDNLSKLLIASVEDYAIFMLDPNGYILSWSPAAEHIGGYTAAEAIGQSMSMFFTTDDLQKGRPRFELNEALKHNRFESEGWRIRKNGTMFWANSVYTTLYDDKGYLLGFVKVSRDITARKKKEEHQQRMNAELEARIRSNDKRMINNERRFRKLIENSYDGITLLDIDLQIFYRSRSAERILGWTNVERTGYEIESLVHLDDINMVNDLFKKLITNPERPLIVIFRARHKKGHYIWIENLLVNRLSDPDIGAIVCNFRDVTERIKTEEQLIEKSRQIEHILASITDGFIAFDKDFNYTFANNKIGEMLGTDPKTLIGKNVWELYPDAVGTDTYNAFQEALKEQRYVWNEDYYAPLGLWQENHIYPTAEGLSVFVRDITERKLAEILLQQSESNLRSVFENTDLAICLFDTRGNVLSFNSNASALVTLHFKKELKAGQSIFHYSSINRREHLRTILKKISVQSPIVYEISYPLPDQTVWFEVRWVSVTNDAGAQEGIILTLKDITYKKEAELERERMTRDLIQRNKDLEQFTYIVSHNLRAPVANIKGLTNIMLNVPNTSGEPDHEALEALSASVNALDSVILDLNDILQISASGDDILETVSLPLLVEEVEASAGLLIRKNRAKITCDFAEVKEILSLKSYLYSIFQNLIVNSIKFRRPDVNPVIHITAKLDTSKVCLYFKDNGKGIDLPRQQHHLFGLYKRFDMSVEGKGMGLFMVKMQTERLGGKISVESTVNEGTEFKLEFPLK